MESRAIVHKLKVHIPEEINIKAANNNTGQIYIF